MLTKQQAEIIHLIEKENNVLITGPGGVGKSYVISYIGQNFDCVITAMTGSAAVLIGGKTLHSTLGIGLAKETSDVLARRVNKKVWTELKLLIIDEISMLSAELLDKIEYVGRVIRKNSEPFGGIKLVLSGDFLQLPPVDGNFCFNAKCWKSLNLKSIVLKDIKRQSNLEFQNVLNSARFGCVSDKDMAYLLQGGSLAQKNGIIPTNILCKNIDVDTINMQELKKLSATETFTYEMDIKFIDHNDILQNFKPQKICSAPTSITLAIGAQVMLLVNKDQESQLVNGSRGVVTGFTSKFIPIIKFTCGIELPIGFHAWEISDERKVLGHVHALPLKLAWALTCHKAQGASIDSACIDLFGVFEYGQAYMAISRVRCHESLILKNVCKTMFKAHPKALEFYKNLD